MKVIIDTNVLVSAILKDRVPEEIILFVTGRDDFEWIVSPEIIAEYREVLARPKFGLPSDKFLHAPYPLMLTTLSPVTGISAARRNSSRQPSFLLINSLLMSATLSA